MLESSDTIVCVHVEGCVHGAPDMIVFIVDEIKRTRGIKRKVDKVNTKM